jgi:hypothetical protein
MGFDVSIAHGGWGRWATVRLTTEAVETVVVSDLGSRVISLRDRRRDREWLLAGAPPGEQEGREWGAEDVEFSGRESFGWDECLPTVAVCADPRDPTAPPLRDHGDQWGRGASQSVDDESGALEHTWSASRWPYRLTRRLSFAAEDTLRAEYTLASLASEALPLLWSQHPVLRLEPGTRLELPGVSRVHRTGQRGIDLPAKPSWPSAMTGDGRSVDLARVRSAEGWAAKLYAMPSGPVAAVAPDGARLEIDWDRGFAPAFGIWLAYGGWPAHGMPYEQVALEPTTSTDDDLVSAQAAGRERLLSPGGRLMWWVTLRLA